jgi:uncharacterized protein (UPF0216 family)
MKIGKVKYIKESQIIVSESKEIGFVCHVLGLEKLMYKNDNIKNAKRQLDKIGEFIAESINKNI